MALYKCRIIIIVVLLQFANVYLFADDAKLYRHILSDEDHYSLQSGLCALQEWSDTWLRKLNASSCKSVYYSRNINNNYVYNYVLGYVELCIAYNSNM